ncbi:MAG: hypothetical protein AAF485_02120 [Chloroflexota bacterium]
MEHIDDILNRQPDSNGRHLPQNSGSTDDDQTADQGWLCPICGGVGYLRQNVPVGHPDFGKLIVC